MSKGKSTKFSSQELEKMGMYEYEHGKYRKGKKEVVLLDSEVPRDYEPYISVIKKTLFDKPFEFITVNMKPMSVNRAWQGKRFKTPEYLAYEKSVLSMLPKYVLPKAPYKLSITLAVSSKLADIDNPVKLITDILQKAYNFNDKEVYELHVKKIMVEKRKEHFQFSLTHLQE